MIQSHTLTDDAPRTKLPSLGVLIAEDDTNLAKLLARQVESLGLTVIGKSSKDR